MLDLQRASAGSGKTYTLARQFIQYMIGYRAGGTATWRLRDPKDMRGALGAILAVTFTNKATNEMQMRIVDKLDALARHTPDATRTPDYLDYFTGLFRCPAAKVSEACSAALKVLLDNYSDFNVSTIDSFFQTVMRTLAFESGFADNYQIELEGDYVSRVGINATLDDIDSSRTDSDVEAARKWVRLIIDSVDTHRWNIFQMSESSGKNTTSAYSSLLSDFKRIDNEDFRNGRDEIEKYLANPANDLMKVYETLEDRFSLTSARLLDAAKKSARLLDDLCDDEASRKSGQSNSGKCLMGAGRVLAMSWDRLPTPKQALGFLDKEEMIKKLSKGKTAVIVTDADREKWERRLDVYAEMYARYEAWLAHAESPECRLWVALQKCFPFLGLLKAVSEKRRQYLDENNAVELGETSLILNKIIAPTDTPFVYERMGTSLHHFLIDEFQDTSLLQWKNLRPLLEQSLSTDNDNLIIGDAKQSIYRFRNAEPKLINETVIREIGADNVNVKGVTPQENTNWRSDRRIVEWNNRFFTFVVDSIGEYSEVGRSGPGGSNPFASVYANVIQDVPDGKDDKGFVRVYVSGVDKNAGKLDRVATTIELVEDALRRGYRLSDIAILTRNNAMGTEIVEAMRTYNLRNAGDAGKPVLEFVSEQSLLIGRSMAVMQIETVLDSIANGTIPDVNGDGSGKSPGNIHKLRCNILLYSRMHPEWPMARCMEEFINEEPDLGIIDAMLGEMQTTALPALVEAVIASFISPSLRRRDAVFLAAFQDCVLEYCESHPSDLPSFLKWWERARKSRAISSPEDVDAIRIMTIHKAKGLEFPVVIIPEIDNDSVRLGDQVGGRDWRWVPRSRVDFGDPALNDMLPPMMPVRINDSLAGTCLAGLLNEHYFLEGMDTLNVCYVAMTRAVGELYVMTELTGKDADAPARGWARLFQQFADSLGDEVSSTDDGEGTCIVEYGSRPEYVAKREKVADADDGVVLDDYHATHTPDCIKCREESMPEYADAEDLEEDDDPRSMGNVCHAIMERVIVAADIDREIMRARVRGLISGREEYLQPLRQALLDTSDKRVLGWFGGGAERVVTERPILNRRQSFKRPDRIMEWPAAKKNALPEADIIDYKFGRRSVSKHRAQVRNYVGKLKDTGRYSRVRGWLWYVFDNADDNGIVLVAD